MTKGLNKVAIDTLITRVRRGEGGVRELLDDREPGLRIRAGERSATWSLAAKLKSGKSTRVKLGTWPGMGIAEARDAARSARRQIESGQDPNEEKRIAVKEERRRSMNKILLCAALDTYQAEVLQHRRTGNGIRRALDGDKGLLRKWARREIGAITNDDLREEVKRLGKQAPIAANRKLAHALAFFKWCVLERYITDNPAKEISKPGKEQERDRYPSVTELQEIWAATSFLGYPFGQLFQLLIVLPMRRQEITAINICELKYGTDLNRSDAEWLLASSRTKKANALRVPLSSLARSLLSSAIADESRPQDSDLVFTTTGETPVSGYSKAKKRLDALIHEMRKYAAVEKKTRPIKMEHWILHDLRTSFNTIACEDLLVDAAVADRILNHVATATTSKVMRIYNKSELFEPRRRALEAWCEFLNERVVLPAEKLAQQHRERILTATEAAKSRGEVIVTEFDSLGPRRGGRKIKLTDGDWPRIAKMLETDNLGQVSKHLGVSRPTLNKFRQRMSEKGVASALSLPFPSKRKIAESS